MAGNGSSTLATRSSLATPSDLAPEARTKIAEALNVLLADAFALYLKTKNYHWHMVGSHYRDYHLLLDEQADQIFAATDVLAERVRKIGGTTIRSIGHIGRLQTIADDDAQEHSALEMLETLCADNQSSPPRCVKRTAYATTATTSRAPVCSRTSSTSPSAAYGFFTKRSPEPTTPSSERVSNDAARTHERRLGGFTRESAFSLCRASSGRFFRSPAEEADHTEAEWRALAAGDEMHQMFGLFDGEELVGITSVHADRDDPNGSTVGFGMTYIRPAYRGMGFAARFYEARLAWARSRPQFTRAVIGHRRSNDASRKLIERFGFRWVEDLPHHWPDGTDEDDVCYELPLH